MGRTYYRQLVWDLPTRLFHWLLVALFAFSWWSGETQHMAWHAYSGCSIFGLILFRTLWGFVGNRPSRFTYFLKSPAVVWSYIRSRPRDLASAVAGHNPLGGWSVLALLLALSVQVVSGIFAVDVDGIESGPLSYLVTFDNGRRAAAAHELSFSVLLGLVALHISAILFYLLVKRRNLIWAMISGVQALPSPDLETVRQVSRRRLIGAVIVSATLAYGMANGFRF